MTSTVLASTTNAVTIRMDLSLLVERCARQTWPSVCPIAQIAIQAISARMLQRGATVLSTAQLGEPAASEEEDHARGDCRHQERRAQAEIRLKEVIDHPTRERGNETGPERHH
jgi:hypothetical protein